VIQGRGTAEEDKEGRLEGVLDVVGVVEQSATHSQHHRPMTAHQRCERLLLAPGREPCQQFAVVAEVSRADQVADTPQYLLQG
jgi:hypothetical protein